MSDPERGRVGRSAAALVAVLVLVGCGSDHLAPRETETAVPPEAAVRAACEEQAADWCADADDPVVSVDDDGFVATLAPDASIETALAVCRVVRSAAVAQRSEANVVVRSGESVLATAAAPRPCSRQGPPDPVDPPSITTGLVQPPAPQVPSQDPEALFVDPGGATVSSLVAGENSKLVRFDPPIDHPFLARVRHDGGGLVRITMASGSTAGDVVEHDGLYEGTVIVLASPTAPVDRMGVSTDGRWAVALQEPSAADRLAPVAGDVVEGRGDQLYLVSTTAPVPVRLSCPDCSAGVEVAAWSDGQREIVASSVGPFDNDLDIPPGPLTLEIRTSGLTVLPEWTLRYL